MSKPLEVVNAVLDAGFAGLGPLCSATGLADEYLGDARYADHEARINALIHWETGKLFTTGFLSGLGGLLTLPVALPAGLGVSWAVQARLVGAIARIHGHDVEEDRVRTLTLLAIVGDIGKEVVKQAGIEVGHQLGMRALEAVPKHALSSINRAVGFRLVSKAGPRGIVNLSKVVPLAGGLVGGAVDALACRAVGATARRLFCPGPLPSPGMSPG
ncbi:EcsC family protein [Corallococcus sp. ZKHCc1 1396]|uniref:EcsC family protein n=1 Tax=Corallococcus soli TaxID=2710757 RepID=A0ABR9PF88_9BACT|nr:EcsC family protein [Corallococcus soli]MBE4746571.1 EcsC family protein [Corallococcus soli]